MKKIKFVKAFWALLFLVAFTSSCNLIKAVKMLNSTELNTSVYTDGVKTVEFIEMVHIGKPLFYENVKQKVKECKEKGFVLFYEYVNAEHATDLEKRKIRKMIGFLPSKDGYQYMLKNQLESGKYVFQDNKSFLNLSNADDYNIDVTYEELLQAFENKYGKIILTKNDYDTPLPYMIEDKIPMRKTMSIILDYRNTHLAKEVNNAKHQKIVILYGALHNKGFYKELKKLNPLWKRVD